MSGDGQPGRDAKHCLTWLPPQTKPVAKSLIFRRMVELRSVERSSLGVLHCPQSP